MPDARTGRHRGRGKARQAHEGPCILDVMRNGAWNLMGVAGLVTCGVACGDDVYRGPLQPTPAWVALDLAVVPNPIPLGTTAVIETKLVRDDGLEREVLTSLRYESDTEALAEITHPANIDPKRTGQGWIEAFEEGFVTRVDFEIVPGPSSVAAVHPGFVEQTLDVGDHLTLTSEVEYADGTRVDGAGLVTWVLWSNTATISGSDLVVLEPGLTTVVVRYEGAWRDVRIIGQ